MEVHTFIVVQCCMMELFCVIFVSLRSSQEEKVNHGDHEGVPRQAAGEEKLQHKHGV